MAAFYDFSMAILPHVRESLRISQENISRIVLREKRHRKKKDVAGAEYVNGFCKEEKINPCVTLVLFWGEQWDGPEELLDMIDLKALPEPLRPYVNNYHMHLVNVREFGNTDVFKTDLKLVFDFMKQTKQPAGMRKLLMENDAYKSVPRDAYEVMRAHANLKELDMLWEEKENESSGVMSRND